MRVAQTSISIDAPLDLVWTVMVDMDSYGLWNPFIVKVVRPGGRPPKVGDDLALHVRFRGGKPVVSQERITTLREPEAGKALLEYEFYGKLHKTGLVRGRRKQVLAQGSDGSTSYLTEEHFRGALAFMVPTASVQDGFERHAKALKLRAETLASARG